MSEVNISVTLHTRWWFRPLLMAFAFASVLLPKRLRDKIWAPAISWIVRHSAYTRSSTKTNEVRHVSVDNGDRGELYDCHGAKIDAKIVSADLVTGRCIAIETDDKGQPKQVDGWILKNTVTFPAPLRFERFAK